MIFSAVFLLSFALSNLEVGPGKPFSRIEEAVAKAKPGDTILVYPDPDGYPKTAVRIQTPSITIRGYASKPVAVKGDGYDYSGSGSVPRAFFQIEPMGKGCKIENFELSGAHNTSFNGAGVRIQSANYVTVSNCIIHDNDMGIMSNGKEGDPTAASNQSIEHCLIERNGNLKDPGYNHNLYLGGTSVKLSYCEIRNSTTGHNVKSRAHYIEIVGCYIHDAANREIDLPEAWDTIRPNSNAILFGNRIVKDPNCSGNRGVIHFGQEKGIRNGNIYVLYNSVVTPFSSPVLTVTAKGVTAFATGNTFLNIEQPKASLWESMAGDFKFEAKLNRFSPGYGIFGPSNITETKRSNMLGLLPPLYFGNRIPLSAIRWIDGMGHPVAATFDDQQSKLTGPRLR